VSLVRLRAVRAISGVKSANSSSGIVKFEFLAVRSLITGTAAACANATVDWFWPVVSWNSSAMMQHAKIQPRSAWRLILEVFSWFVLSAGFVFVAQIALVIVQTARVTTDSMCSSAGALVVLLIGSLLNSVARE